jgi:hypothetical protein
VRPTPTETLVGVVAILNETVAPTVSEPHARAQLAQAARVLHQLSTRGLICDPTDAPWAAEQALWSCRRWISSDPAREATFSALQIYPGGVHPSEVADAHNAALERFLLELGQWRVDHGPGDSQELFELIGGVLAGGRKGKDR